MGNLPKALEGYEESLRIKRKACCWSPAEQRNDRWVRGPRRQSAVQLPTHPRVPGRAARAMAARIFRPPAATVHTIMDDYVPRWRRRRAADEEAAVRRPVRVEDLHAVRIPAGSGLVRLGSNWGCHAHARGR
jgi:hypothetical protein